MKSGLVNGRIEAPKTSSSYVNSDLFVCEIMSLFAPIQVGPQEEKQELEMEKEKEDKTEEEEEKPKTMEILEETPEILVSNDEEHGLQTNEENQEIVDVKKAEHEVEKADSNLKSREEIP